MKICVFTATRAEYGLLKPVMTAIRAHPDMTLQVMAGGSHFSPVFGHTYRTIEADGFTIDARAPIATGDDTPHGLCAALAPSVAAISEGLERLRPDAFLFLGDRYELMAAATAAAIHRVPMIHLFGGEITHGAFDEQFRHALTKMAHIHCVPTQEAANRVIQMGEDPASVFVTGHPALDALSDVPLLDRAALSASLGMALDDPVYLMTYHPETLGARTPLEDLNEVLAGLDAAIPDATLVITHSNADPGYRDIAARLEAYAAKRPRTGLFASLGQQRYYSLLNIVVALIGNSSSGLHEAPSFGTHTVNIGGRQGGRTRAASVIDVPARADAIATALRAHPARPTAPVINPYEKHGACRLVIEAIASLKNRPDILKKTFHTLPAA